MKWLTGLDVEVFTLSHSSYCVHGVSPPHIEIETAEPASRQIEDFRWEALLSLK